MGPSRMAYRKSASWDPPKWVKRIRRKKESEKERRKEENGQLSLRRPHVLRTQAALNKQKQVNGTKKQVDGAK